MLVLAHTHTHTPKYLLLDALGSDQVVPPAVIQARQGRAELVSEKWCEEALPDFPCVPEMSTWGSLPWLLTLRPKLSPCY